MGSIRVHLGQMPPMLRSMISDLLDGEADLAVVGNSHGTEAALAAARADRARVILTMRDTIDPSITPLLATEPLTVLAFEPDGQAVIAMTVQRRRIPMRGGFKDVARILRKAGAPRN